MTWAGHCDARSWRSTSAASENLYSGREGEGGEGGREVREGGREMEVREVREGGREGGRGR